MCTEEITMRSISAVCGAIAATVCLAPGVQASDHRPLLTLPSVHSTVTAPTRAPQAAMGQSSASTTSAEPAKPEKDHVTTQKVVEHTTTVEPAEPVKPEKVHVTTQKVVEHTTTVDPPKPGKLETFDATDEQGSVDTG